MPLSSSASAGHVPALPPGAVPKEQAIVVLKSPCPSRATPGATCPPQRPVVAELEAARARVLSTTTLVDTITAEVTPAQARALAASPLVSEVVPDGQVRLAPLAAPALPSQGKFAASNKLPLRAHGVAPASLLCGARAHPELDPQALQAVTANRARAMGAVGAGVTVAILADGLHATNADLLRNAAYGRYATHVVTQYVDFTGEGTRTKTGGEEAFGDVSSIAAQANTAYNLSQYVNPAVAALFPKSGCWVKILGTAPGASLMVLKVIGSNDLGTDSGIVEAIQYAVQHGAKVINESFGGNPAPDTGLDVVRQADDAAVAAGVTVVVSSGDGGPTSTIGSPATDPNVISVGATTNLRAYAQSDEGGIYNPAVGNGHWVSNNISSISSGGYDQAGGTVDLVAPGDLNWALCSTNYKLYTDCSDILGGKDIGIDAFGGTSEAAPLTSGGAADVIQAYARTHSGALPPPALVKQILCSTATDIDAPAAEQGAGMLNIAGAVRLAESLPAAPSISTTTTTTTAVLSTTTTLPGGATSTSSTTSSTTSTTAPTTTTTQVTTTTSPAQLGPVTGTPVPPVGEILLGPPQINVVAKPGARSQRVLTVTNAGPISTTVSLSTRALTDKVYDSGTRYFTLDPAYPTTNTGVFPIWSGVTEVYQVEKFRVPAGGSRLVFSADYQHTDQTSLLHFGLFEPNGTYAGYSDQQAVSDYGEIEVANPPAGKWTALFFTVQNGATKGGIGTSGTVQWDASVWDFARGSSIDPSQLSLAPGQTGTAVVSIVNPTSPGDSSESLVVSSPAGRTTVPVTVRTMVSLSAAGGTFTGVLSGGNGRQGVAAQTNTYFFDVPKGKADLDVSVALNNDPGEALVGSLVDPNGQTLAYSSNYTLVPSGNSFVPQAPFSLVPGPTPYLQLYHAGPQPGLWELLLQWQNPVTGNELEEGFTGAVRFDQVLLASSGLPRSSTTKLAKGQTKTVTLYIANTGVAPEAYFVDPRLHEKVLMNLKNLSPGTSASRLRLPRPASPNFPLGVPIYLVPTGTSQLQATVSRLTGTTPISFDMSPLTGDPDVAPAVVSPAVKSNGSAREQRVTITEPQLSPGLWDVVPAEVGPWSIAPAPKEFVNARLTALTRAFDPAMHTGSDDFWQVGFRFARFYYVEPDQVAQVKIQIVPISPIGTDISGTLFIDDFTLDSFTNIQELWPDADQVAAVPYSYTVGPP